MSRHAKRPVIGVLPSPDLDEKRCIVRDQYVSAIVDAGGVPSILPITPDATAYETLLPLMDGFILTGGHDIDAQRYGENYTPDVEHIRATYPAIQHGISRITPHREEVECLVLSYAYRFDVPVLGICRGMQMMNVFFGGTLYTDLADQFGTAAEEAACHWQQGSYDTTAHCVDVVRPSRLGELLGADQAETNSMHHQGVRDLAPSLDAVAFGPDGLIEAIEVRERSFMLGVQWHPEFFAGAGSMGCLFEGLVREAESSQARRVAQEATLQATQSCDGGPRCPGIPQALSIVLPHEA